MVDQEQFDKVLTYLDKLGDKYESLVWYARGNFRVLPGVPKEIIDGAKDQASRLEEIYIDEVQALKDPRRGDWTHGFNSGMLAALRLVLEALSPEEVIHDDGDGDVVVWGGLDSAIETFPDLNT